MVFRQFYLGCLAHASYLIGSGGEAAVVDPQRDVRQYLDEAERQGLAIRYVLETHLHADFVSGHRELAALTGAEIVYGAAATCEFPFRGVREGEELRVGSVVLRTFETPGHTPESVCWLVTDEAEPGAPARLLTGDTLFIGDVGRPDLVGSKGFTPAQMASMMYDSLAKLLALPDETEVWPAHGAGSACGRNISRETSSTLGQQRRTNYALRPMAREEFVTMMTTDLAAPPRYFSRDAEINRRGPAFLDTLSAPSLSVEETISRTNAGAMLLDVRPASEFGEGHVPGSVNIGLGGDFASWAGTLLDAETPIILVASSQEQLDEAVTRLARVGLDSVAGHLAGGVAGWSDAGHDVSRLPQVEVEELHEILRGSGAPAILDVRRPGEFAAGHVPAARNLPLADLPSVAPPEDAARPVAIICAGGYRSSTAASLLLRRGYRNLYNVVGGTSAWIRAGFETAQ